MSLQAWLGTPEAWLSIVGAVTGISGFVIAVIAHRHSTSLARTNLLHDVEVAHDKAARDAAGLLELLPLALASRQSVFVASGGFGSGRMQLVITEHAADMTAAEALKARVATLDAGRFARMSYDKLMKQMTELRKLQGELDALTQKYEDWMAADQNDRNQLRADRRADGPRVIGPGRI